MRVFVYFNLHKKVWSVKALQGPQRGRVIMHSLNLTLRDCQLKVSQAGRERVLREKRKNVHAGVVGTLTQEGIIPGAEYMPISYNPYKAGHFVNKINDTPVFQAKQIIFNGKTVHALSA